MMKQYRLFKTQAHDLLFEGFFPSFTACLEQAVKERLNLEGIDLSHQNLSNASLDEAVMPGANFTNANLSGANLSESYLRGASFRNAALYNTCLCFSNLTDCDFEDSSFGATDICGSILAHSRFSTLSCFTLNFSAVRNMHGCTFLDSNGVSSSMSLPPLVVHGLNSQPIVVTDQHVRSGHNVLDRERLLPLARKISDRALMRRLRGV